LEGYVLLVLPTLTDKGKFRYRKNEKGWQHQTKNVKSEEERLKLFSA